KKHFCKTGSYLKLHTSFLKKLNLSNNSVQGSGVQLLCPILKSSCYKLEILRKSTCEKLGFILKLHTYTLKDLDFSNNDLRDSGVQLLCTGLECSLSKLEISRLVLWNLIQNTVLKLHISSLRELDLSNNNRQDSGVQPIFAGLMRSHYKLEILIA
ncbi:hypothetical protein NFI96_019958, partial [Prochilodus magdalenae]